MRIAEYKQTGTRTEEYTVTVHETVDDDGNIIAERTEVRQREVPVMGMVYRDMTAEEEAEYLAAQQTEEAAEPTTEERLAMVEDAFAELCEVIFNG